MYESFYGLKEKPFSLLPDPAFLYLSKQHEMAITLLRYGLENQTGFSVISGRAGTGKTTLLRRLLNQIGDDVSVGLISHTHHSFGELMRWILHAFDLEGAGLSRAGTHQVFIDYLLAQYAKNRRTMLIVDEAQNMAVDALEELRMLSNINSGGDLLLQVILVGQPPLRDILRRPELEQLAQRIAVDYHLDSLNRAETRGYIRHRIVIVGGEHELFTEDACDAVYEYCGGNPRLINLLCDLSLVYAYASRAAVVTGELVEQVVMEREQYGALPLFAPTGKPRIKPDLPSNVVQAMATATTPVAAAPRIPHKTVAFKAVSDVRGAIPTEAGNKATRHATGVPTGREVKVVAVHETKSNVASGQIAMDNRNRPASERRRYIPAVAVVGLFLAMPLAWYFTKQPSANVHVESVTVSPSPIVAAAPVASAASAEVTSSGEPSVVVQPTEGTSPARERANQLAQTAEMAREEARR
ncbi:MAG: AAA family ATPase [Gammaproteobacteria bacterium]|nr:AAA family ATPase [Gammaproteobacteria bacterium]